MIDVTSKIETLRYAKARAVLTMATESILKIKNNKVPKGNVLEISRTAGYIAVKKTSEMLPLCHPMPVEWINIDFSILEKQIEVFVEVKTIYKTGCEMEALFGASCTAMCIYDMLKPIDKNIEITSIKLLNKTGGKSEHQANLPTGISSAVVVISDSVSQGKSKDLSGKVIQEKLLKYNINNSYFNIIPDDVRLIQKEIKKIVKKKIQLIITTGGTGLSKRDLTPQAIKPLLETEIPGIIETARNFGQKKTPLSMLSRGVAGMIRNSLVITLPGSPKATGEYLDSVFPYLLHTFKVIDGYRHD